MTAEQKLDEPKRATKGYRRVPRGRGHRVYFIVLAVAVCFLAAGTLLFVWMRSRQKQVTEISFGALGCCYVESADVMDAAWQRLTQDIAATSAHQPEPLSWKVGSVWCGGVGSPVPLLMGEEECYTLLLQLQNGRFVRAQALMLDGQTVAYVPHGEDVLLRIAQAEEALTASLRERGYSDVAVQLQAQVSTAPVICFAEDLRSGEALAQYLLGVAQSGENSPYLSDLTSRLDAYRMAREDQQQQLKAALENLERIESSDSLTPSGNGTSPSTEETSSGEEGVGEDLRTLPELDAAFAAEKSDLPFRYALCFSEMDLEILPFETEYRECPERMEDYLSVEREGESGSAWVHYTLTLTADGLTRKETTRSVRRPAVSCLIRKGTRAYTETGCVTGDMIWPTETDTGELTSIFGIYRGRVDDMIGYHTGFDIKNAYGTDVWAADGGTVVTSGYTDSYGNYIILEHGDGLRTLYAHLSRRMVAYGDRVYQGQVIGQVGLSGNTSGAHLHFEVRTAQGWTDPAPYLPKGVLTYAYEGWYPYVYDKVTKK